MSHEKLFADFKNLKEGETKRFNLNGYGNLNSLRRSINREAKKIRKTDKTFYITTHKGKDYVEVKKVMRANLEHKLVDKIHITFREPENQLHNHEKYAAALLAKIGQLSNP